VIRWMRISREFEWRIWKEGGGKRRSCRALEGEASAAKGKPKAAGGKTLILIGVKEKKCSNGQGVKQAKSRTLPKKRGIVKGKSQIVDRLRPRLLKITQGTHNQGKFIIPVLCKYWGVGDGKKNLEFGLSSQNFGGLSAKKVAHIFGKEDRKGGLGEKTCLIVGSCQQKTTIKEDQKR